MSQPGSGDEGDGTDRAGRPAAARLAEGGDETLIPDPRWHAKPSEAVERRLVRLLRAVPVAVSQVSASLRSRRAPPESKPGESP